MDVTHMHGMAWHDMKYMPLGHACGYFMYNVQPSNMGVYMLRGFRLMNKEEIRFDNPCTWWPTRGC